MVGLACGSATETAAGAAIYEALAEESGSNSSGRQRNLCT
ncbi:MAG: hypothetical protein RLZZ545_583 [Actinomycetota bacterium]